MAGEKKKAKVKEKTSLQTVIPFARCGYAINRAAQANETLAANEYSITTYHPRGAAAGLANPQPVTVYYGPGQSITTDIPSLNPNMSYRLRNGVVFRNC